MADLDIFKAKKKPQNANFDFENQKTRLGRHVMLPTQGYSKKFDAAGIFFKKIADFDILKAKKKASKCEF